MQRRFVQLKKVNKCFTTSSSLHNAKMICFNIGSFVCLQNYENNNTSMGADKTCWEHGLQASIDPIKLKKSFSIFFYSQCFKVAYITVIHVKDILFLSVLRPHLIVTNNVIALGSSFIKFKCWTDV